ncbi:hypothetical protein V6N11_002516 [Hibiscus sabdariffa]|uniref:Uncharacterized protein n=1 Tax=Hibiscus sabdariffa TaxID=183260 RepID=A0ABR2SBC8_9ROSI
MMLLRKSCCFAHWLTKESSVELTISLYSQQFIFMIESLCFRRYLTNSFHFLRYPIVEITFDSAVADFQAHITEQFGGDLFISGHLDEEEEEGKEHEFFCEELLRRGDLEETLFVEKLLGSENFEELEQWVVPEASFFDSFHFPSM